jgi:hypothetical protein
VVLGRRATIGMCTQLVQQVWAASQKLHSIMPMQSEAVSCHLAGTPKLTPSLRGRQSVLSRSVPDLLCSIYADDAASYIVLDI